MNMGRLKLYHQVSCVTLSHLAMLQSALLSSKGLSLFLEQQKVNIKSFFSSLSFLLLESKQFFNFVADQDNSPWLLNYTSTLNIPMIVLPASARALIKCHVHMHISLHSTMILSPKRQNSLFILSDSIRRVWGGRWGDRDTGSLLDHLAEPLLPPGSLSLSLLSPLVT